MRIRTKRLGKRTRARGINTGRGEAIKVVRKEVEVGVRAVRSELEGKLVKYVGNVAEKVTHGNVEEHGILDGNGEVEGADVAEVCNTGVKRVGDSCSCLDDTLAFCKLMARQLPTKPLS